MADIKEFIKKQTNQVTIGIPKRRTDLEATVEQPVPEVPQPVAVAGSVQESEGVQPARAVGRPKSEVRKVKLSAYVPAEVKERLVRLQHESYRSNLNDVLVEAIMKYLDSMNY